MILKPLNTFKAMFICLCLTIMSCSDSEPQRSAPESASLFSNIPLTHTGVNFRNEVKESNSFNFLNYAYTYNGGGVAIADFNNDGLNDLYFTANQKSNKLFLNKGDFKFEDVSDEYGATDKGGWTTGVTAIDINNDGWMDLYVCKSGSAQADQRKNKLFINNQGKSFTESAEKYGLADASYSTQAYFFDYDKDGDLDVYVVNHRADWGSTVVYNPEVEKQVDPYMSDRLFQNNGNHYTDVTAQAGLLNKAWGLSACIYDFNQDGWEDIYVANDFIHGDKLYINNQKGRFTNQIHELFDHTSFFSMGSDISDINNDGLLDLLVLDMVSEDHVSNKKLMAGMSTSQFRQLVALGNHYQYMTNILQLNQGNGLYSDIAYSAGIASTDWSWAPLIADFDNDGFRDIYITNGIKRDVTDNDFKIELQKRASQGYMNIEDIYNFTPSRKVGNYFFKNNGDTRFDKLSNAVENYSSTNSNGAAYGDLDNDGDLDLVINNLDEYATVLKNNSHNDFIKIQLKGPEKNKSGLGTVLQLHNNQGTITHQHYITRGFQSSVASEVILAAAKTSNIIEVYWPDGKFQQISDVKVNESLTVDYQQANGRRVYKPSQGNALFESSNLLEDQLTHKENEYDDFVREILLPQKYSTLGPRAAIADVNGDGLEDVFMGGASGQSSVLLLQDNDGRFASSRQQAFSKDAQYEDIGCVFIDGDNDGDMDLYVVSGGNEHSAGDKIYQDRYYLNDGKGQFKKSNVIPQESISGGEVIKADWDNDGDIDLFVCGRITPGQYPYPTRSMLLQNEGGSFKDVTQNWAASLENIGMVSDACFSDIDNDQDLDLLMVGEWMGLVILENEGNAFSSRNMSGITGSGWWYSISEADFNNDGYPDYVLGNLGLNNKFEAKKDRNFHVFCSDFDNSGNLDIVLSKEKSGKLLPVRGRECSSQQMPFIKEKFESYNAFAHADLEGIYGKDNLNEALHYTVDNFESVVLISDGKGGLSSYALPMSAQYGPTLSTLIMDVNNDGNLDIIGAGAIYDAEVETVRYDANKGYVLLGDGHGGFSESALSGLNLDSNVKQILPLNIKNDNYILALINNGKAQLRRRI